MGFEVYKRGNIMNQYKFEHDSFLTGKNIKISKTYDEEYLHEVLDEFAIFLTAIGYNVNSLLDCITEDEFSYLMDKQSEYRRKFEER
jgi:hypothetical protein